VGNEARVWYSQKSDLLFCECRRTELYGLPCYHIAFLLKYLHGFLHFDHLKPYYALKNGNPNLTLSLVKYNWQQVLSEKPYDLQGRLQELE